MNKPFNFHELTEEAKIKASEEVAERELAKKDSWDIESQMVSESLGYKLNVLGLGGSDVIEEWGTYPIIDITLKIDYLSDDFLKKHLSEKDYKLYNQLKELTDLDEEFFVSNNKFYSLEINNYRSLDEQIAMKLIMDYSENQEDKAEFAFIELFNGDLTSEQSEKLEELVIPIAEGLCEDLEDTIGDKLEEIHKELKEIIESAFEYYESPNCYYDSLENEGHVFDTYRFNENGNIVEVDDEILFDFEEDYEEYILNRDNQ